MGLVIFPDRAFEALWTAPSTRAVLQKLGLWMPLWEAAVSLPLEASLHCWALFLDWTMTGVLQKDHLCRKVLTVVTKITD